MLLFYGMTIWILALVLLAAGVGLGFSQGAIRAGISFFGIVIAALFAGLLGNALKPLLPHIGIHNPTLIWAIAPLVAFGIILLVFKVIAFFVHRKVYLFYKYRAGDLRMALWKRLNARLGMCIGLLNGTAYLLLVSFVIYNLSYWTVQVAPSESEPFEFRALNRLGRDLDATGFAGAAHAVARLPNVYYQLADLAGLLRQNPQLADRIENYPAFLGLAENSSFKQLGQDSNFQNAWKNSASILDLLKDAQATAMLKDSSLTTTVMDVIEPNWDDLNTYLTTGKSPKYGSEKIIGRWNFNVDVSVAQLLITHPRMTPADVKATRALWSDAYAQTRFIAAADHQAFMENIPRFAVQNGMTVVAEKMNAQGEWENQGTNYTISAPGLNGRQPSTTAKTDGLRLTIKVGDNNWVFDRE